VLSDSDMLTGVGSFPAVRRCAIMEAVDKYDATLHTSARTLHACTLARPQLLYYSIDLSTTLHYYFTISLRSAWTC
jgi:hypothetical protein